MKDAKKSKEKKLDPKKLIVKHVIEYDGKNVKKSDVMKKLKKK